MSGDSPAAYRRSLLSVPASSPDMIEKAFATDADAVMIDLEDAVAPDAKAGARRNVVQGLNELDPGTKVVLYRANALDTPYFYRDLIEVVEEAGDALDAVVIPKVNHAGDLYVVDTLLSQIEAAVNLGRVVKTEAQIESAAGLANADTIANASGRLEALHFGPGDYAASMGMPQTSIGTMDEWDHTYPGHRFHYAMQRIVVAARAAGIQALDGPVADYRDEEGLRESCAVARSLGFDGKWCIHPAQIGPVNETFSPTGEEVAWAEKVVGAYEAANTAGSGSISVEGQMIDAASIRMARRILDIVQG
ncbi:MAG: HpcH/HpaI aldolase/citrate lyase family protein [Rubrobacteraceae bacterium]